MAEQAYAYVTLIPVAKGFQSAIAKELSGVGGAGGKAGKQAGDSFSGGFGNSLKGLAKVAATAFAAVGVVDFFKDSVSAASNFNAEFEGVNQVFGTAAKSVQDFADSAATNLGISETKALNAAKQFGIFATSAGLAGEDAAGFSTQLVQAAADLGSFNDVPVEQTLAAITSGLQGSSEPLRQFGIFLDETSVAAYAANNGLGDAYDNMTSNEKTLVRQAALMEQMGVQAGDFGKYAGDLGNSTKTLQATFEDMQAELGQALIPALEALMPALTEIAEKATPVLLQVFEALNPVIVAITDNIGPLFDALTPLFDIFAEIGSLVGEIAQTVLPIFVQLIEILMPVVTALAQAFLPLVEKLLPPFAKLLEAILPFIQELADFLIQYIIPAFEALGSLLGDTVIWVVDRLTEGLNWLYEALGPVWDFLKPIIEGLLALAGIQPGELVKEVKIKVDDTELKKFKDVKFTGSGGTLEFLQGLGFGGKGTATNITVPTVTKTKGTDLAKVAAENKKKLKELIQDTKKDLIANRKDYNDAIAEANKDYNKSVTNITDTYNKAITAATKRRDEALAGALKNYNQNVAAINEKAAKDLADIVQQSMNRLRDAYRSAAEVNIADMFASDSINKNVTGLIDGLRDKLTKSRALLENAAKLASAGFSQTFIEQVVSAGTETGNELAQGILNATPDQQRELQDLFTVIDTEAAHGMDQLAQTLYDKNGLATEELRQMYEQVLVDQKASLAEQKRLYDEAIAEIMVAFEEEIAQAKTTRDEALLDAENALNEALLKANQDFVDELDKIQGQFKEKVAAFKSEAKALASEISALNSAVASAKASATTKITGLKSLIPLASGGLVTGPTPALVGEAGPELVIPLDRFQSLTEASGGNGKTVNYYAAPNQSIDNEAALFQAMRRAKVVANW